MIWYENEKKYSKQELKEEGKDTTKTFILLVVFGGILSFLSIYDSMLYPVLLFNLTGIIVYNFRLMRLKKEYYERFCK
jgi:uncharacterized protein YqhQ